MLLCESSEGLLKITNSHHSTLVCVSSYVFSRNLIESRQSHIGCICLTFLQGVFACVSSNYLYESMHNYTGCICLTFLQCAFSNVPSNCLSGRMQSHIGYISVKGKGIVTLPMSLVALCVFKRILKMLLGRMHNHIACICLAFIHCAFSYVSSNCLSVRMQSHIGYIS